MWGHLGNGENWPRLQEVVGGEEEEEEGSCSHKVVMDCWNRGAEQETSLVYLSFGDRSLDHVLAAVWDEKRRKTRNMNRSFLFFREKGSWFLYRVNTAEKDII